MKRRAGWGFLQFMLGAEIGANWPTVSGDTCEPATSEQKYNVPAPLALPCLALVLLCSKTNMFWDTLCVGPIMSLAIAICEKSAYDNGPNFEMLFSLSPSFVDRPFPLQSGKLSLICSFLLVFDMARTCEGLLGPPCSQATKSGNTSGQPEKNTLEQKNYRVLVRDS